jgi:hypothetical protein
MRTPSIHLNGTSRQALFEAYSEASSAVRRAISATVAAAPHARDYYPQGEGAFAQAQAEHVVRMGKLAAVRDELYAILEAISETP